MRGRAGSYVRSPRARNGGRPMGCGATKRAACRLLRSGTHAAPAVAGRGTTLARGSGADARARSATRDEVFGRAWVPGAAPATGAALDLDAGDEPDAVAREQRRVVVELGEDRLHGGPVAA